MKVGGKPGAVADVELDQSELRFLIEQAEECGADLEWFLIEGVRGALNRARKLRFTLEKARRSEERELECEQAREAAEKFRRACEVNPGGRRQRHFGSGEPHDIWGNRLKTPARIAAAKAKGKLAQG